MGRIKILQVDGGGIKGIIPASVIEQIEKVTGRPSYKTFDMITGTSTGSIIGGMLANGVPGKVLLDLYVRQGKDLFKKIPWYRRWFGIAGPKYDRRSLLGIIEKQIKIHGAGETLGDCKTDFISTTFNGVSGRTHYQMSWKDRHKKLDTAQVISWSALSAVHFFGPICVPDYPYSVNYQLSQPERVTGAVFYDGGQGRNNCTLLECITTALKRGWLDDNDVEILSLGCGNKRLFKPYKSAKGRMKVGRLADYINQSRDEAIHDQLHKAAAMEKAIPNLHIHRMDVVLPDKLDSLDALKGIPEFVRYGNSLRGKIPAVFLEK